MPEDYVNHRCALLSTKTHAGVSGYSAGRNVIITAWRQASLNVNNHDYMFCVSATLCRERNRIREFERALENGCVVFLTFKKAFL